VTQRQVSAPLRVLVIWRDQTGMLPSGGWVPNDANQLS
jgi:hypothetical protein